MDQLTYLFVKSTTLSGNYVWNPVYGKQLLFLSATSYFDLFFELGGGVMMSDFYPERNVLNNGNEPRAPYYTDEPEKMLM